MVPNPFRFLKGLHSSLFLSQRFFHFFKSVIKSPSQLLKKIVQVPHTDPRLSLSTVQVQYPTSKISHDYRTAPLRTPARASTPHPPTCRTANPASHLSKQPRPEKARHALLLVFALAATPAFFISSNFQPLCCKTGGYTPHQKIQLQESRLNHDRH